MIDIDQVKLILRDTHKVFVLNDMIGPTDINGGQAFIAASLVVDAETAEELAAKIYETLDSHCRNTLKVKVDGEPHYCFALYQYNPEYEFQGKKAIKIRFGCLGSVSKDL